MTFDRPVFWPNRQAVGTEGGIMSDLIGLGLLD